MSRAAGQSINRIAPPRHGLRGEQCNLSPLDPSRAMYLTCPICYTRFSRPPSHVARNKWGTYCGRGCAAEGRKVRIDVPCVVCGKQMELRPCDIGRKTTCSKQCSSLRRRSSNVRPKATAAYKKAIRKIATPGVCENCETNSGPWIVRGVIAEPHDDGSVSVDSSGARLLCRPCYFSEIGVIGVRERDKKYKRKATGYGWEPK